MKNFFLKIGWMYPDLMSTYGDRGNIIALQYRCLKRKIKVKIEKISLNDNPKLITQMDILFMGGAQDKQQEIVNKDLRQNKSQYLIEAIEKGLPCLFVCGAYQFLGKYYKAADGTKISGLGIFDLYTENPGQNHPRLIGNIIVKPNFKLINEEKIFYVGFENHGGRTYLTDKNLAFATVVCGFGNNGIDKTEGIFYKNSIGTYLHGPILPKNPSLTDFFISKALERKYNKKIRLKKLNDEIEEKAREKIIKKLKKY